jgi:hypothetical protein
MKSHGSVLVVRMWCGIHGGAELWGLASRRGPQVHELTNGLRLSTAVLSQDLSGPRVTIQG